MAPDTARFHEPSAPNVSTLGLAGAPPLLCSEFRCLAGSVGGPFRTGHLRTGAPARARSGTSIEGRSPCAHGAPVRCESTPMSLCGSRSGVQGPDPRSILRSVDPPRPPCGEGVDDRLGAVLSAKPLQHDAALECRLQTAAFSDRPSIACPDGLLDLGDLLRGRRIVDRPDGRVGPSGEHALARSRTRYSFTNGAGMATIHTIAAPLFLVAAQCA